MSHKRVPSCCIVVDASVARAAGPFESTHPTGSRCREFLIKFKGAGHRLAWNESIRTEWDRHQSTFARTWRVSMVSIGKLRPVPDDPVEEFREAIQTASTDPGVCEAMLHDALLFEAAWASDHRVASLDETVRGHFGRLAASYAQLRLIVWVNPANEAESPCDWLEVGAPDEAGRRLRS